VQFFILLHTYNLDLLQDFQLILPYLFFKLASLKLLRLRLWTFRLVPLLKRWKLIADMAQETTCKRVFSVSSDCLPHDQQESLSQTCGVNFSRVVIQTVEIDCRFQTAFRNHIDFLHRFLNGIILWDSERVDANL